MEKTYSQEKILEIVAERKIHFQEEWFGNIQVFKNAIDAIRSGQLDEETTNILVMRIAMFFYNQGYEKCNEEWMDKISKTLHQTE